ncbi:prolipoprotein diacylglyceryl transferase [Candidatus Halocynthiibacter alkanivorans]|uniref:prolipoprotein diacylglyceryl transferase n=1 Tax=Candidatus Halocynthiibacter alkanivorans TaxID=2267619 RepID=UPI000DF1556C|nr:prolipoprotein diacylglyceryl transferase [Candidatus Halocynthiibacter alkanivorans]
MIAVLNFPDVSPELFTIELGGFAFALRWYALAYIAGILIGWKVAVSALRRPTLWRDKPPMSEVQLEDLLTWLILGVILGGRLGFVLFYQPGYYLANPAEILKVWEGGMSFHGGFLGVATAGLIYCRRHKLAIAPVADLLALGTPIGLMLGRIANFINAELWGRPSDLPWAVIFPGDMAQYCPGVEGACARHPSQLYEAGMEGLILGAVLFLLAFGRGWLKRPGAITGLFLAGYGLARFIVEFFRQADAQFVTAGNPWGQVFAGMTMGQLLSLPMLIVGLFIVVMAWKQAAKAEA